MVAAPRRGWQCRQNSSAPFLPLRERGARRGDGVESLSPVAVHRRDKCPSYSLASAELEGSECSTTLPERFGSRTLKCVGSIQLFLRPFFPVSLPETVLPHGMRALCLRNLFWHVPWSGGLCAAELCQSGMPAMHPLSAPGCRGRRSF